MYLLADINEIFFKIESSFDEAPLFDLVASADGYTQEAFLEAFYPTTFLKKVGKKSKEVEKNTTDHGVYYDKARRSKLFNGALPESRKRSLRSEIIFCITLEEWDVIYRKSQAMLTKCSEANRPKLEYFLHRVLKEHKDLVPETMSALVRNKDASVELKLAMVMFLYLFLPLDITSEEMQNDDLLALGTEIGQLFSCEQEKTPDPVLLKFQDGYEYVEFGRYPQTVSLDEAVLSEINQMEEARRQEMLGLSMEELAKRFTEYKKDETEGVVIGGERYVKKFMHTESLLDNMDPNAIFSDGTAAKVDAYYCKVEPIRWRVLEKRQQGDEAELLLLSEKILFSAPYNEHIRKEHGYVVASGKEYAYSWESSDVRDLLNSNFEDSFMQMAFTQEERACILDSTNDQNAGWYFKPISTVDKVFVLSELEANQYLFDQTPEERDVASFRKEHGYDHPRTAVKALGFITDYALLCGVKPYDLSGYNSYFRCPHYQPGYPFVDLRHTMEKQGRIGENETPRVGAYWLRSPGDKNARILDADCEMDYTRRVACITQGGFVNARGACVDASKCDGYHYGEAKDGDGIGVRPAMRIRIQLPKAQVENAEDAWMYEEMW